ncbi:MAG: DUF2723 domain-containing protein [Flavobacteriales bacterium]|nr:DUF2723 domain-containing protein [Flavobacteriales bacterium]
MDFNYKKWNTILGWFSFIIAFITYLLTIEPDFSFWDCGEYIASAAKLEVTHSPGAALFQIVGAFFSILAFGDGSKYGMVINAMSALFSALTILFLFWTITHITLKALKKNVNEELDFKTKFVALAGGLIGALSFTFTDTFWFSAVEGEVYSMASLFTAMLFWMICKWENTDNIQKSTRWLLLISFVIGLSVGVHMMVLLVIPAICFVYYVKNYKFSIKGFIIANLVTLVIFGIIFKGIFPFVMSMFGNVEIFFVNDLRLPFNSGSIFTLIVLVLLFIVLIRFTIKGNHPKLNTIVLSVLFMLIGFSSWMVIPIRANANPPMNLNNPDNAIGMLDYYNREQYGDWPVGYGANYTAHLASDGILREEDGSAKKVIKGKTYEKNESRNAYIETGEKFDYVYNPKYESILPRMYNPSPDVMEQYALFTGYPEFEISKEYKDYPQAQKIVSDLQYLKETGEISISDYQEYAPLLDIKKPTFLQNMKYFFDFQNGYMFVRYFLWNFAGRQNDFEGHYEINKGNWVSGFSFIDNPRLGNQQDLPSTYKNKSTNYYYLLPLILGLIGLFFHLNSDTGRFYALLSLFLLTSVGIILYTSVKPFEPRERDYALVSSFYVFAIWIGLGASFLLNLISKNNFKKVAPIGFVLMLASPIVLASENWDDHDRSNRTAAYDQAYSYLVNLDDDSILFTYGDNDTYPLWAIQETSGFRTDVKIVNYTLLGTAWNIDQVKRKTYKADPIPGKLKHDQYRDGKNDLIRAMDVAEMKEMFEYLQENDIDTTRFEPLMKVAQKDSMTAKEAMDYILTKNPIKDEFLSMMYDVKGGDVNLLPVKKIVIPVNKENAIKYGIVQKEDADQMVDYITVDLKTGNLRKELFAMLDMFANYDWNRSIYFSSGGTYSDANVFFLKDYMQFEGFSYKLVPIKTPKKENGELGRVNPDVLYNIIKNYKWGNFKNPNVHYGETAKQNLIIYRNSVSRAAEALVDAGEKEKAREILNLANTEIPVELYPSNTSITNIVYSYLVLGDEKKAMKIANEYKKNIFEELDYYDELKPEFRNTVRQESVRLRYQYAMLVESIIDGYKESGQEEKAKKYISTAMKPIDDRYKKELNNKNRLMSITSLVKKHYSPIFSVLIDVDSTYVSSKLDSLEPAVIDTLKQEQEAIDGF